MTQTLRRVAVIGGTRIPFCRSNTLYADLSNLDMMTAALNGLVDKYRLKGAHIDEVVGGAVMTHSKDFNLAREAVLGTKLATSTPGITLMQACGTSLQAAMGIAAKIATGEIDSGIAVGSDTTSDAPIVFSKTGRAEVSSSSAARKTTGGKAQGRVRASARRARAAAAGRRRAAHGALHGPALRADGAGVEGHARRSRISWRSTATRRPRPPIARATWTISSCRAPACSATTTCARTSRSTSWRR